ncbi:MAG: transposase [Polyangia bacterium]
MRGPARAGAVSRAKEAFCQFRRGPPGDSTASKSCRYILRSPLANERVSNLPDGRVLITLKKPFRDGATAVELAPLALMARLAAIIPGPRLHVLRYHGLLAPRSRHRAEVVPGRRPTCDGTGGDSAVAESGESATATAHTPAIEDNAAAKVSARRT